MQVNLRYPPCGCQGNNAQRMMQAEFREFPLCNDAAESAKTLGFFSKKIHSRSGVVFTNYVRCCGPEGRGFGRYGLVVPTEHDIVRYNLLPKL